MDNKRVEFKSWEYNHQQNWRLYKELINTSLKSITGGKGDLKIFHN